jgi:hypothetical protein
MKQKQSGGTDYRSFHKYWTQELLQRMIRALASLTANSFFQIKSYTSIYVLRLTLSYTMSIYAST